jgi:uncharacterized protein YjbJ (UPF0337 family)
LLVAAIARRDSSSRLASHPAGHVQIEKSSVTRAATEHGHRNCSKAFSLSIDRPVAFFSHKEAVMNWDTVKGNWTQYKGKVKEQWGKLTDDQIDVIGGQRDQLIGKIQEAYGISKDEAEQQIKSFENRTLN